MKSEREMMSWDRLQTLAQKRQHVVLSGAPGTGKSSALLRLAQELGGETAGEDWSPVLLLTPDRRRADHLESQLGAEAIGKLRLPGGHRIARSVSSYAYLVVAQWLVECRDAQKPPLTTGAEEDQWVAAWLGDHREQWARVLPEAALESAWLRMDLRNLFARVGEYGLTSGQLKKLGELCSEPTWVLAAEAFAAYGGEDPYGEATANLDAARIQRVAAAILDQWDPGGQSSHMSPLAPVPRYVLLDDLQDCTYATLKLLTSLARAGATVVGATSPETATAPYRGGRYNLGKLLRERLPAEEVKLTTQHRLPPSVARLSQIVAGWTEGERSPESESAPLRVSLLSSEGRAGAYLADRIRRYHYLHGIPWEEQAVLVRSASDVEAIRRFLGRAQVPLARSNRAARFSAIPVTNMLLRLLSFTEEDDADELVIDLFTSPLVGADELELFRLVRAAGMQPDADSLRHILASPQLVSQTLQSGETWDQIVVASSLWRLRQTASEAGAQRGLWLLWEAAGKAEPWREAALQGGWSGGQADARLDAVLALFRRADLWQQEHSPTATAKDFAAELQDETIALDSIANVGLRAPGVEVLTVAQAAGREFEVVYVCGLQDGAWPVTSQSGSLFALPRLETFLDALTRNQVPSSFHSDSLDAEMIDPGLVRSETDWRAVGIQRRHDEARLFHSAISRTRGHLHLVVVLDQDQAPSMFINALVRAGGLRPLQDEDGNYSFADPAHPFDLKGIVGELRYASVNPALSQSQRHGATRAIALLADQGVPGADPDLWAGAGPITSTEATGAGVARLSPSAVQNARDCLLSWFLRSINGDNQNSPFEKPTIGPLEIGNLVHAVAEELPYGTPSELRAAFERRWQELGITGDTYWERNQRRMVEEMIQRLAQHFQRHPAQVITEVPFRLQIDDTVISGRIDRIEIGENGDATVVDIKTGKGGLSKSQVSANAQLAIYQLALRDQMNVTGAGLLAVGVPETARSPLLREQDALDDAGAEEISEELSSLGRASRGPNYIPTVGVQCRTCAFVQVCPAHNESIRGPE